MANYLVTDTDLITVAEAIRTKGGTSAQLSFPSGFATAIGAISGGGGSLPSWIEEMDVQTYAPEEDTNAGKTFSLSMQSAPDLIIIYSDFLTKENTRDFYGGVFFTGIGGVSVDTPAQFRGYTIYATGSSDMIMGGATPTATNPSGVTAASSSSFTVYTAYYGGTYCYWRSGHTYTIIAVKVKSTVT